jgi:hypothetical protein
MMENDYIKIKAFLQCMVDTGGKCDTSRSRAGLTPRAHSYDCDGCPIKKKLTGKGISSCPMDDASVEASGLLKCYDQDKDNQI